MTASESTAPQHRVAHALTQLANVYGVQTFTLQHGVENVGLTYFDEVHGRDVRFASKTVFTWADPALLPDAIPLQTRAKCVAVGRPDGQGHGGRDGGDQRAESTKGHGRYPQAGVVWRRPDR